MAVNFGSTNITRWYTIPDSPSLTLPNSDWSWVLLLYKVDNTDPQYFLSNGTWGASTSINFYIYSDSSGLGLSLKVDGLTEVKSLLSNMDNNSWYVVCASRLNDELYIAQSKMGTGIVDMSSSSVSITASYNSSLPVNIGRRSGGATDRYFKGGISDAMFIPGYSLKKNDIAQISLGRPLNNNSWYDRCSFHGYFSNAGKSFLVDLTKKHSIKRNGSSYIRGNLEIDSPFRNFLDRKSPALFFPAVATATTFNITPSGGVVLSGTNSLTFTDYIVITPSGGVVISGNNTITAQNFYEIVPDGGVTLSGANAITFSTGANTYTITPDGGVTISGNNDLSVQKFYEISPSGGIVLSGTNGLTVEKAYTITPDGGVVFSGENAFIITKIIEMNGGVVFSGSNPITSNTVDVSARLPLIGVGK